jgi:hypothetical protein
MPFKSGIWTAVFIFILWIAFDLIILSRIPILKQLNKWIKHSYRRSLVMNIAICIGYLTAANRVLDLLNSLIGTCAILGMMILYNSLFVTWYKGEKYI